MLGHMVQRARIVEDVWCAAWRSLGQTAGVHAVHVDDTTHFLRVYTPQEPELLLNIVLRYREPGEASQFAFRTVLEPFITHRLPFQWWLVSGTEPSGLREALLALGMHTWGGAVAMTCDLTTRVPAYPASPEDIHFAQASTAELADGALSVITEVFMVARQPMARWTIDNPAVHVYVALRHNQPVAAMATQQVGNVIGVFHVATLPLARRMGIAGNLMQFAFAQARRDGCVTAALTATREAVHMYERLGFSSCGMLEQWVPGFNLMQKITHGEPIQM